MVWFGLVWCVLVFCVCDCCDASFVYMVCHWVCFVLRWCAYGVSWLCVQFCCFSGDFVLLCFVLCWCVVVVLCCALVLCCFVLWCVVVCVCYCLFSVDLV